MQKKEILGNQAGVKDVYLDELSAVYAMTCKNELVSAEMASVICRISAAVNREISLLISRSGRVLSISIGDAATVQMPSMQTTHSISGLSGVRCVHTHPNGQPMLSSVDLGTLQSARYDAMMAIGVERGKAGKATVGVLSGQGEDGAVQPVVYGDFSVSTLPNDALFAQIRKAIALNRADGETDEQERAVLLAIDPPEPYDSLKELEKLCENAGLKVEAAVRQKKEHPDPAYYVGKGKMEEIAQLITSVRADVCVCDDELSANQTRNLEERFGVKVIDRTTLILEIFAKRANTKEGKLQVELAQLKYRLPRLYGMGQVLSRLGGGIGTRGPGEKKLETDKRHIHRRITQLERELHEQTEQRALRKEKSVKSGLPVVALVGYTNAGKSTLLNAMSGSDVLAKDQLFATLDPVTRKVRHGLTYLVSDTVGLINKLPHDLINAFASTLEEAANADLLLHVVDSSSTYSQVQMGVVHDLLTQLGADDLPRITVYNKWDQTVLDDDFLDPGSVRISAVTGAGLDQLYAAIEQSLTSADEERTFTIPYDKGALLAQLRKGTVIHEDYREDGVVITVRINRKLGMQIQERLSGHEQSE